MQYVRSYVASYKANYIILCDLPQTSDLQTSTIHNFGCVIAIDLKIVQFRVLT